MTTNTLPKVDLSTSNFRIKAAQFEDAAKACMDQAHVCEAKGKHGIARALMDQAIDCYHEASLQMRQHAEYVRNQIHLARS